MKRILGLCAALVLFSLSAHSQDTLVSYYDADWLEISNQDSASFYGMTFKNEEGLWVALDYYLNGQLQMSGQYKGEERTERHGLFEYYYENGQLKNKGMALDGKNDGKWTQWYEDGQVRSKTSYKAGLLEGELSSYWENGQLKRKDIYVQNELASGEVWDSLGTPISYYPYMEMPTFRGGTQELYIYLATKTRYPAQARRKKLEGTVFVQFNVQKDGSTSKVRIKKGVHELLDAEAVRVISAMPKWKPGMEDGEAVEVSYALPIRFVLPR